MFSIVIDDKWYKKNINMQLIKIKIKNYKSKINKLI